MEEKKYKIIDDFLDPDNFNFVREILMSDQFPWYFKDGVAKGNDYNNLNQYQFTHTFYENHEPLSQYYTAIQPIINKLEPMSILRVKGNLNTRTDSIFEHGYHVDYKDAPSYQRTAVFYLNTNDGYTLFEDGTKVESVANRFVEFDTNLLHTGSTCTSAKRRIVLNFNYIIKPEKI